MRRILNDRVLNMVIVLCKSHSIFHRFFHMPQEIDSQFDALVETYADIVYSRMDYKALQDFVYESLIDYYENMTEHELIEHVVEMEDDDEIVTSIYGNYPVDPHQEIEGRDYHSYSLKEGESLSFPVHDPKA